jgi:(E)-4-hydroxy-3-methylbut-2-enyl-diphosphate synthase
VTKHKRFPTREVMVGDVGIGAENHVRIQSMTNTNTLDTSSTVSQIIRLYNKGCEMVRLAVPGVREAQNLEAIKNRLLQKGLNIPLIADVHFHPKAAIIAAAIADKVRINPGNYSDRNTGKMFFSTEEDAAAVSRISDRLAPLIEVCRTHHTAIRIGSNHGSLSERIISKYGNTPEGMVGAALEFVKICNDLDFQQIVLSMKASSVRMMVFATRLLIKKMIAQNMNYPIHLGVTEAGNGAEGRIKSAIGSGTLLADGIGDTIRVSLTEKPENEIPVAKKIVAYFSYLPSALTTESNKDHFLDLPHAFEQNDDREIFPGISQKPPLVISGKGDYIHVKPDLQLSPEGPCQHNLKYISGISNVSDNDFKNDQILVFKSNTRNALFDFKEIVKRKKIFNPDQPVIFRKRYSKKHFIIDAALDFGPHLVDNNCQGIWIEAGATGEKEQLVELSFQILQAAGARTTKTEYIACPSCGRTQYDILGSLGKIKALTSHLSNLRIAVMGCIVNGPGEMADADYGYIGMGHGKVALFKGKTCVKKAVPENEAVAALINLIKENGDWKEQAGNTISA